MKERAEPAGLAVAHDGDVVDVWRPEEPAPDFQCLALDNRHEGCERAIGRKDKDDGWHHRGGDGLAEEPSERFMESFELGGDITEVAGSDLTDDDEVRTVDAVPFCLWCRGGAEPRKRREQDGCPGPDPAVTPLRWRASMAAWSPRSRPSPHGVLRVTLHTDVMKI